MKDEHLAAIRRFEGFTPRAAWDYKQSSIGYGTKARFPGEVIDAAEAERRFRAEIAEARAAVERFAPGLDEGSTAALTSLTFNAGPAWMRSGLGAAVRAGDIDGARTIFKDYVKAGGEVLPGLVARREVEATWFGAGQQMATQDRSPDAGQTAIAQPLASVPGSGGASSLAPGGAPALLEPVERRIAGPGPHFANVDDIAWLLANLRWSKAREASGGQHQVVEARLPLSDWHAPEPGSAESAVASTRIEKSTI